MNQELVGHIEELGLSNKEACVYVANLMLGPASVQQIADLSGIKRVTTYVILESLVGLGLVSQSVKGKKTYFNAENPMNLRRLLEKREQEVKDQKANFESLLPQLLDLKSLPKNTPSVKFYDSAEGIKSIMKTFLAEHKEEEDFQEIYGISNLDQLYVFFPEFRESSANPTRVSEGVKSRIIYTSSDGSTMKTSDKNRNRTSRWVPADKFPLNGDISVVGHHVIILSLSGSKPIGVTIDSVDIANGIKAFFELSWQAAEQYN